LADNRKKSASSKMVPKLPASSKWRGFGGYKGADRQRVSMVELVEIERSRRSNAGVDALGRLKAGVLKKVRGQILVRSMVGGGTDATITDAHLTLGNIDPDGLQADFAHAGKTALPRSRTRSKSDWHCGRKTAAAGIIELG
jgi:hypothetical protein